MEAVFVAITVSLFPYPRHCDTLLTPSTLGQISRQYRRWQNTAKFISIPAGLLFCAIEMGNFNDACLHRARLNSEVIENNISHIKRYYYGV